tara:strand:+ start:8695 stop:9405 length:711 start_codon:yes stop_codon:yes gene_type:complete
VEDFMEKATLKVKHRDQLKKNKVKVLRQDGFVPAVIYGGKTNTNNVSIYVNGVEFDKSLRTEFGKNTVLKLEFEIDGKATHENVITYGVQRDVITRQITHIDFFRVVKDKKVSVNVPLKFEGVAPGSKRGGVLVKKLDSVVVSAVPDKLPPFITIDLSNLQVNEFISVGTLDQSSYEILTNQKASIVRVAAPRLLVEEEETETEDSEETAEGSEEGGSEEAKTEEGSSDSANESDS